MLFLIPFNDILAKGPPAGERKHRTASCWRAMVGVLVFTANHPGSARRTRRMTPSSWPSWLSPLWLY